MKKRVPFICALVALLAMAAAATADQIIAVAAMVIPGPRSGNLILNPAMTIKAALPARLPQ